MADSKGERLYGGERGFEPSIDFGPYNGLAIGCLEMMRRFFQKRFRASHILKTDVT
jgi:hypothetical protein